MLVHDRGYLVAAARDGTFAFYRPDATAIPASPSLPQAGGTIEDCHDADITAEPIIPPWYGEQLDLDHAIYVCFANAANQASHDGDEQQLQSWASVSAERTVVPPPRTRANLFVPSARVDGTECPAGEHKAGPAWVEIADRAHIPWLALAFGD